MKSRLLLLCVSSVALFGGETDWVETLGGSVMRDAKGQITGIDLRATWVTDTDLRHLSRYPALTYLDLSLTHITDQGMQQIRNLPAISELNLCFAEYVTDEGLGAIKGWKKLRRLNLRGTKISDTTLEHVSGMAALESLNVSSALVTDVGLERLSLLTNLKELSIGGNELGDAGLQALRQIPGLTFLDLNGRQGTDSNVWTISMSEKGLEALLTLKDLRELRFGCASLGVGVEGTRFATVSAMSVTEAWLEKLRTLPRLERLQLQGCDRLNDNAAPLLAKFPMLQNIDLKGTAVTEKGVTVLRAAKPKAQIYYGPWEGRTASFRNN